MAGLLPEPRVVVAQTNPLLELAVRDSGASLAAALAAALAGGDDGRIWAALHDGSPAVARRVWQALAAALDDGSTGIALRLFAIPLVIVAGARTQLTLPGVVPEIGKITALLEHHGAVGATRNFGLGNALCSAAALEALSPAMLWRANRDIAERAVTDTLVPEDIVVGPGREQVHLRFLVGAGVTPQHLPSFTESASNIGTWGMPLTRELARQLAQPGLEVLPLPRSPQPLLKAAYAGRRAQLEAALNLFLGNTIRRFRMSVGDPEAILSAHRLAAGAGELRLSLGSQFDESLFEGFCWPLHPLDDAGEIAELIAQALADCRITNVTTIARVLPDRLPGGAAFVAQKMVGSLAQVPTPH
jgi:hypothetical protein